MANILYTTPAIPFADTIFNGGLNSTSSPLNLKNNESSSLLNIDFDRFGSITPRNGYACLTTASVANMESDGLYWYEYNNAGTATRYLTQVINGKLYKMDALDGVWDTAGGAITITSANMCDFETFLNKEFVTNGTNPPFEWAGSGTAVASVVPANLTKAKYVKLFQNYLFYSNVTVNSVVYPTRSYWCNIRDTGTWDSANWIEVSKDDGQEITGKRVLANALVYLKERSIYNLFFTGNSTVPFQLQKSNSTVGCIAPFSIQEIENGLVFLSYDGIYYYDGMESYKISDKITTTLMALNTTRFKYARSVVHKSKNRYLLALTSSGGTYNDTIIVFDYYNKSFSVYTGLSVSAMAMAFVDGYDERIYFSDNRGFTYRGDYGVPDYPLNTATAIESYYYTNWRSMEDLVHQKAIPQVYLYHDLDTCMLNFSYSFDFEEGDQYTNIIDLSSTGAKWDSVTWDNFKWAGSGGKITRRDLSNRGRLVRFKFRKTGLTETFKINGFGWTGYLETNA